MLYAIVEVPRVGKTSEVLGVFTSLRSADSNLRRGQQIMQVMIDATLGNPDAIEAAWRIEDAMNQELPANVVRFRPEHDREGLVQLIAQNMLDAASTMHAVVIASHDLQAGQRLSRDDVFRYAFRANALRCKRRRKGKKR